MRGSPRLGLLLALTVPAALLAAPAAKAPVRKPPAPVVTRDWSQTVVATPEGGFRMGNPNARLKLIEYGSITCPHCADFNAHGVPALRDTYVRSGRLSWEYRPYMIFPTDPGIFLLLNCLGPGGFFPASDQLYAQQEQWVGRLQNVSDAEQQRIDALPLLQQSAALVRATGVDQILRGRGLSEARANTCFADEARLLRLVEVSRTANRLGVTGTPTFLLNGRLLDEVRSWEALEPLLKQAG
jgi:protein-disulfide isomerase